MAMRQIYVWSDMLVSRDNDLNDGVKCVCKAKSWKWLMPHYLDKLL